MNTDSGSDMQRSTNNPWFAVSIGLMGLILGFSVASFTGSSFGARTAQVPNAPSVPSAPDAPAAPESPVPEVTSEDHYRGSTTAPVTIVEYMDYECPFCHRNAATVKAVIAKYGEDKVAHVVRHFPLDFHQQAMPYARAGECVASLGGETAFWKFTDTVFAQGGENMSDVKMLEQAAAAGVSSAKVSECVKAGTFDQKIKDQQQAGATAGINGTPGVVVVDNKTQEQFRLQGAVPDTNYFAVIDPILAK